MTARFVRFVQLMREREVSPGVENSFFGFTFEQPNTKRAYKQLHIRFLSLPENQGGCAAKKYTISMCCFGAPYGKPTDIWVGNLPALDRDLQMPDGTQRFKCRGQSSWHKHSQVRGRTADSVRFPPGLVHAMGRAIHETYTSGAW